ncbi:hypothetical protein VFPFJ_10399 [Purpureocillium lilacinum]|uniref:Uncharacterized protein n=2 Tax=Purpureocillium lilacinum TaxID=33203 RepID=A0A179GGB0_PURLI|nr:hypothetical protein VFPFJ_10399 [Purpureocillium lilacinum]KAK4092066.1 hypothetical protein Purlil1_3319 [Purpureocillium lilacinum]OAQ76862.1 hypothetical protein VFPFJ_10399 [Purpureocillium lilacinum]OAQ78270.1 hypothetical protein VFPBJ_06389 [Purpureocillium lilacinum]GJN72381.1 hypothetical protein PLICBS_006454 [Purpureocillium lilacinum]GJN81752.1 hypothetical protein PLIIFM63780_005287 [Purpureocillium lilacinum]
MSDRTGKKNKKSRTFSAMDAAALLLFDGAMTSEQKSKTAKKLRDKHDDPSTYGFYDTYTTSKEKKTWKKLKSEERGASSGQGRNPSYSSMSAGSTAVGPSHASSHNQSNQRYGSTGSYASGDSSHLSRQSRSNRGQSYSERRRTHQAFVASASTTPQSKARGSGK